MNLVFLMKGLKNSVDFNWERVFLRIDLIIDPKSDCTFGEPVTFFLRFSKKNCR